jgi:hypothetical protein
MTKEEVEALKDKIQTKTCVALIDVCPTCNEDLIVDVPQESRDTLCGILDTYEAKDIKESEAYVSTYARDGSICLSVVIKDVAISIDVMPNGKIEVDLDTQKYDSPDQVHAVIEFLAGETECTCQ